MTIVVPCSALSLLMAASLAALPSMVIFSGTPWRRIAFVRNRLAACSSRASVRRKSIVWPVLSTARESAPLALYLDVRLVDVIVTTQKTIALVFQTQVYKRDGDALQRPTPFI